MHEIGPSGPIGSLHEISPNRPTDNSEDSDQSLSNLRLFEQIITDSLNEASVPIPVLIQS
jgi:hypothetical protein